MIRFDIFSKSRLRDSYGEIGLLLEERLKQLLLKITREKAEFIRDSILSERKGKDGIVLGDVALYNQMIDQNSSYDKKMILSADALCGLFRVQPGTRIDEKEIQNVDINFRRLADYMDVQCLNKVLCLTTNSKLCTRPNNSAFIEQRKKINNVFSDFIKLRNQILGHSNQAAPPEGTLRLLEKVRHRIEDNEVKSTFTEFYLNGSNAVTILEELGADLSVLIDDIHLYIDGYQINQNSHQELDRRFLFTYTVVADEWAFQSKFVPFLTQDLLSCNTLNVFDTTVRALNGIRQMAKAIENGAQIDNISITADESAACKNALRELKKHVDDQDGRVKMWKSFTDESGTPFDSWGNIFALLDRESEQKICIVTDYHSEPYARKIIARGNPNHVVVYLNSSHTVSTVLPEASAFSFTIAYEEKKAIPSSQHAPRINRAENASDSFFGATALAATDKQSDTLMRSFPAETSRARKNEPLAAPVPELLFIPREGDTVSFDPAGSQRVRLGARVGGGAEGDIYAVEEFNTYVVKIYRETQLTPDRLRKLQKMLGFYRSADDKKNAFQGICWPVFPVYCLNSFVGYAMDRVSDGNTLEDVLAILQSQDYPKGFPAVNRGDLLKICEQIIDVFMRLHSLSIEREPILMGDVNPKNIMVTKEENHWGVWLVDVDSYQFGSEPCPVGRQEFFSLRIAQALENRTVSSLRELPRVMLDEKAALATLLFYTLMIRQLPYSATADQSYLQSIRQRSFVFADKNALQTRHNYIWQNLTPEIKSLFQEAFGGGKGRAMRYPELTEWRDAIYRQRSETLDKWRYSNEIFPTSSLRGPDDEFIRIKCRLCGQSFELSKETRRLDNEADYNAESDLCPNCKNVRSSCQAEILSCVCKQCGRPFTVSTWDYNDNEKCPDCDPEFVFSRKNEFSDPESFSKKLRQKITDAVKNYMLSEE